MFQRCLVTGATGFVGGHFVESCAQRGIAVNTISRPASDASLLDRPGVTVFRGDFADPAVLTKALADVEVVVHCAAKVGDWGPLEEFRAVNVEALRRLLDACKGRPLTRFVQLSSLGVYEARHHYGTDETEPLPQNHQDAYAKTKVESEELALRYQREAGIPVVLLRPGFIYGPRDRTVLPRLIEALRKKQVPYFSGGRRALNTIYVGNLVDAIFLAIENPSAVGQAYNLTDGEFVSKRQYIDTVADGMGLPRPGRSVPLWLALFLAGIMERRARRRGDLEAPRLTRARVKFLGLNLDYSIEKAKRELHYQPRVSFAEGMRRTLAWYRQNAGATIIEPRA
jgi:nucleoside-diphosphate-sugar epimerase